MTVTSQPSPAAWMTGIAQQTSVHRPAMISCLRPVALTTFPTFSSCQVFTQVRSMTSWSGKTSVICLEISPPRVAITLVRMVGTLKAFASFASAVELLTTIWRIVAAQVRELIRLVVDQDDDRVFGTEKRGKAAL